MSLNLVASSNKVGSNHLQCLSLIKSNLHSSISFTVSEEVIILDIGRNDMLDISNFLHSGIITIPRKTRKVNINNLLAISWLIIVASGIVT